jgi:Domain of unknown function (DUF4277)
MCEALGLGDVIDQATPQHPARPIVTAGTAVKAMGLNGLGCVPQRLDLVPQFFQPKPTSRLSAPARAPAQLNDETLGRAFDTLDDAGVTALCSRMAATAAQRLGRSPTCAQRDRPSCPGDGRDQRDAEPDEPVLPITQGYRRDHRPDRNHVMRDVLVEHHAGLPRWRPPRSGHSGEGTDWGPIVPAHIRPWSPTSGTTSLGADRALYRDDTRPQRAAPPRPWLTRVPASVHAAHPALAPGSPEPMPPLMAGSRDHECRAPSGGVPQRWVLLDSARRPSHVQRTVNQPLRQPGEKAVPAVQQRCRVAVAGEAAAPQALAPLAPGWEATCVHASPVRSSPRDGQRGRPRQAAPPAPVMSPLQGALASRRATRQARGDQHRGCILAPTARDDVRLPPQVL